VTAPTVAAPLAGLTVVEYGDDLAAAYCGKHFADLGAVVLLARESRLRDETAALRVYVDGAKKPLCDVPDRIDVAIVPRGAKGVAAAVTVHISDFGETGPQASWRGGEIVSQAASGLMSLIGDLDGAPLALGGHQIDNATGWMAFTGAQIALTAIDLGNAPQGQNVRISRLEVGAYIEWKGRVYAQAGNELMRGERSGPLVVRCADGWFGLYYRAQDWDRVLTVLDDDALRRTPFDTHHGRLTHSAELATVIESLVEGLSQTELYRALQNAGVPAGPVMTAGQLIDSEQYAARHFMVPVYVDGVAAVQPAPPVTFNGKRPEGGNGSRR
jgi:crotonobetainyl-CoA:carnitine CoA-transferase CaiB-like acyl-CoA transferase